MKETKQLSFDLDERMLDLLGKEFNVDEMATKFAGSIANKSDIDTEKISKEMFQQYGTDLMKRAIQLGDEYSDRVYEVMKAVIAKTGVSKFPHIPQRFLEIAYLSTQPILSLSVLETNRLRIGYQIRNCAMYKALIDQAGDQVANMLPCRNACLAACETVCQDLDLDVSTVMEAETPKEGYCQFLLIAR